MAEATRKLLTIFYADVAGYSRLTGLDEEGTHRRVMEMLDEVTDHISQRGGRVLRYAGDAVLASFDSATAAFRAAREIQTRRETVAAQDMEAGREPVQIRIGLNLGDVIEDRGEVFGDGVNLAARLEAQAWPGGICLSDAVKEQVAKASNSALCDGGCPDLKNILRPVHVWHWTPDDKGVPAAAGMAQDNSGDRANQAPAIAVLPFDNMSGDPEQDYFADGLTEDIITALSYWRSFPVIARNSVFTYKNQPVRVQQVAQDLGVQYVLEGSVRKAGNRVRITAQLIEATSGHHVWAEKYDRLLEDIFDVQDEITNHLAAIIVPELESHEWRRRSSKRTENLTALDFYFRGMATFHDENCAGTAAALPMFEQAVQLDPSYGDAWARIAWCYAQQVMFDCVTDPRPALEAGFAAGHKAVALDEFSSLAHYALGTVHIWANETGKGLEEAQRAVELNPNFANAVMGAGNRMDLVGRTEEGIAEMERALLLNPRDPIRWRYMSYLSRAYISIGQCDVAEEWGRKGLALRPHMPEALFRYALCLAHLDRVDEALDCLRKCHEADNRYLDGKRHWQPYPDPARNKLVMSGLERHDLLDRVIAQT